MYHAITLKIQKKISWGWSRIEENCWTFAYLTSDAGSQYRCGRVGRGSQPPFTPNTLPNPLSNTDTYTKSFQNAHFPTFRLVFTDRRTDQRMDKASYRVACPQLKNKTSKQVMQGRNIIAGGWAGAYEPHSYLRPLRQLQVQHRKCVFSHYNSSVTNGLTDGKSIL